MKRSAGRVFKLNEIVSREIYERLLSSSTKYSTRFLSTGRYATHEGRKYQMNTLSCVNTRYNCSAVTAVTGRHFNYLNVREISC